MTITWQGLSVFSRRREIDIQSNARYSLSFSVSLWWFFFWRLSSARIGYLCNERMMTGRSSTNTKYKKPLISWVMQNPVFLPLSLWDDFSSEAYHLQELIILAIKEHWPGRLALIQNAKSHCQVYEWTVLKLALINLAWETQQINYFKHEIKNIPFYQWMPRSFFLEIWHLDLWYFLAIKLKLKMILQNI